MKNKNKEHWFLSEIDYLFDNYPFVSNELISSELLRSVNSIKQKARLIGLSKINDRYFTPAQEQILIEKYADTRTEDLVNVIGKPVTSIYRKANQLGLKKSEAFKKSGQAGFFQKGVHSGKQYQFPKGHKPFNVGMKQVEYMSAEAIEKTKKTRFAKGVIPKNTKPVGTITMTKARFVGDKTYQQIKVGHPNEWKLLHVHNWEKENGPVPHGHLVVFKDGNTMNCEPSNLKCISKAENMARNTIQRYPNEIQQAIRVISKVKKEIKFYENNQ